MKEPIKMHVEFSLLYKTLLIIEMSSKIFKAKGGAAEWFQYKFWTMLTSFLSSIVNRRLWLISFLQ